jgi:L-alanine-DL-glutamate epimerase-like enolase superfamily enzyme
MKLARWSLHFYRLPYRREVTWAYAAESASDYALLTLTADNGAIGIAEGVVKASRTGFSPRSLAATLEDVIIPLIRNTDLADPQEVTTALGKVPESGTAKALLDNACWTLRAMAAGKPLWRLWGGTSTIELSWIVTRQSPARMAAEAAAMRERFGFRSLKVKGGQVRETDLQVLAEVRAAVGPQVELSVDANGAYPRQETAAYVRAIADAGVSVAEDPCELPPDRALETLQRECALPLLIDFGCTSVQDARLYLERAARALMIKPGRVGLSQAAEIDSAAAQSGAQVALGMYYESALGTLIAPQIATRLASAQILPPEHSFFLMLGAQVSKLVPDVRDGVLQLAEEPNLSTLVDWEAVKHYAL